MIILPTCMIEVVFGNPKLHWGLFTHCRYPECFLLEAFNHVLGYFPCRVRARVSDFDMRA